MNKNWFWILISLIVLVDLTSKYLIKFFNISFVKNFGLAFGVYVSSQTAILITAVIITALFFYMFYKKIPDHFSLPLSLILAGALANFLDRIFFGFVTDFIKIGTGYFNLADIFIFTGIFFLIMLYFKKIAFEN